MLTYREFCDGALDDFVYEPGEPICPGCMNFVRNCECAEREALTYTNEEIHP